VYLTTVQMEMTSATKKANPSTDPTMAASTFGTLQHKKVLHHHKRDKYLV